MRRIYVEVFSGISYDEMLPMIREIGFDGYFTGTAIAADLDRLTHFKRVAEGLGLYQETSHSTIPGNSALWASGTAGDDYVDVLKTNVLHCGKLGIPTLVVHVQPSQKLENNFETGAKRLKSIVRLAKEQQVKLAFENINSPDYLYRTLDCFQEEHVGFCYDCGHEACHTFGERFLPQLGERLFCTHLHDNDCKGDLHRIPFDGQIDFETMARELKDCRYTGNLTLELLYDGFYNTKLSKMEFLQKAYDAATRLRHMIDE